MVDAGTGNVEETDRHPYSDPDGERLVRFLGTGDPQYNQAGDAAANAGNDNADETIASMNEQLGQESDIRGVVISGDLTQVAVESEFNMYKNAMSPKSTFYHEGLGNHDLLCAFYGLDWYDIGNAFPKHSACDGRGAYAGEGGLTVSTLYDPPEPVGDDPNVSDDMKRFVFNHTTQSGFRSRATPKTWGASPHYSWDWHDVHFIQLNLFPGNEVDRHNVKDTHYVDPMDSLDYLKADLFSNATPLDGTIGKPVVIIHHYGPFDWCDSSEPAGMGTVSDGCSPFWSADQKRAYWNAIRNYNVVAILYGHRHFSVNDPVTSSWSNPEYGWYADWSLPSGATERPAHLPADIPVINLAAARGTWDNNNSQDRAGVYFDITMDCTNRMTFTRRWQYGWALSGHTATVNFCSSFAESSCPGEADYQDCDADLDGINDSVEVPHGCLDASNRHSDGDGIADGVEDANRNGVVDAGETDPCSIDSDGDGDNDDVDNCPVDANPDQTDGDGDGIGDVCDPNTDTDGDFHDDPVDNCPDDWNFGQSDFDSDGLGDACDPDDDNDGVDDVQDTADLFHDQCRDLDADSCDDCSVGVDGYGPLADYDVTNDGPDLDGDGLCDAGDSDVDGDEIANTVDTDDDNDGLSDADEAAASTDPYNPDSDGDGIADGLDRSPDDESNVASGCGGTNAVLSLSVFDTVTCPGIETSETLGPIEVDGVDDVDGPGDLLMLAPFVEFAPGFFVEPNARLGVVSSRPDSNSEPVCTTYISTDVPVLISASGTPTVVSTLNVPDSVTIADLNVSSLSATHTWINDLDFNLTSPASTTVQIMARSCGSQDDLSLGLNDEAAPGAWPCPPIGGTYQPSNPLTAFDGENGGGTWTLTVNDNANLDGGSLDGWALKICANP